LGSLIEVEKRSSLWILRALVFIGSYALFFTQAYPEWEQLNGLSVRGARTTAEVVGKEPNNHQTIRYAYTVDGQSYTGQGLTGRGGVPAFEQVNVGDSIVITYLPANPVESGPGYPGGVRRDWDVLLFVLLPMACLLLALGVRRKKVTGEEPAPVEKTV
jgi:Protein of unknown function (DUF3592)